MSETWQLTTRITSTSPQWSRTIATIIILVPDSANLLVVDMKAEAHCPKHHISTVESWYTVIILHFYFCIDYYNDRMSCIYGCYGRCDDVDDDDVVLGQKYLSGMQRC